MLKQQRFLAWCGQGMPKAWAASMGIEAGDIVYPITDETTSGTYDGGWPRPEQMLCWCPSHEKQILVIDLPKKATSDISAWEALDT